MNAAIAPKIASSAYAECPSSRIQTTGKASQSTSPSLLFSAISGIYPTVTSPPMALAEIRDAALVDSAKAGDQRAFSELVRRHQARIFRVVAHIVKSSAIAEEIAQETFVRAYKALATFDGRSEPYTWLYRIAVNLALNELRSQRTRGVPSDVDDVRLAGVLESGDNPHASAQRKATYQALCQAIDTLNEALRTTLILVCIDGMPHEAAAQVLGIPEGTVAWRVHEARKRLREHLAGKGITVELGERDE
jgi:RNA polymerase sigma-70 factor, ECF subfamily